MIEREFIDRVPQYPGRVKMTPVAGQTNVFDMVRADGAVQPGTPLNKVTFESLAHSRLTGRYYALAVSKVVSANTSYSVTPIPSSGWVADGTEKATTGAYVATASPSQDNPWKAFDGTWSTNGGWRPSHTDATPWIAIDLGSQIVLRKVRIYFISDAWATNCTLAGSNDGTNWTNISTKARPTTNGAIDWSFTNTTAYRYYRLSFDNTGVRLYGWAFTDYTVTTYSNTYTVPEGFPSEWTDGQIALVSVPTSATTLGIVKNTLNGVTVNTILQPGKRYELRYSGTAFAVKEV